MEYPEWIHRDHGLQLLALHKSHPGIITQPYTQGDSGIIKSLFTQFPPSVYSKISLFYFTEGVLHPASQI